MSTTEAKHTPELWYVASMGNHQGLICKEKTTYPYGQNCEKVAEAMIAK